MTAPSHRGPASQVDSRLPGTHTEFTNQHYPLTAQLVEVMKEDWEAQLNSLQGWICELLIKNQQLRIALMDSKVTEPESH